MYQSELFDLCNTNQLVVSDQVVLGWIPEQYTYVSNAHCTTSWLDRVLCNQAMQRNLKSVTIIDKLPSSDHLHYLLYLMYRFSVFLLLIIMVHHPMIK